MSQELTLSKVLHAVQMIGTRMEGFETRITGEINDVKNRIGSLETKVDGLVNRISSLETKVNGLDHRMSSLEIKVDGLDHRMGSLENRMGSLEAEVNSHGDMTRQLQEAQFRAIHILEQIEERSDKTDTHHNEVRVLHQDVRQIKKVFSPEVMEAMKETVSTA